MLPHLVPADPAPDIRTWTSLILLVGAAVHSAMILEAQPLLSANDKSRWCTVWSLIEQQTYRIDTIRQNPGWDTIDLVLDDGHFYSTKPPLLATWVAGIVWVIIRLTGWSLLNETQQVTGWALLIANGLPMLASWMLLARLLRQTMSSVWGQGFLLSVGVFGTLLTPFSVTLNNHTPAAVGAMLTVYALWKVFHDDPPDWKMFALCGAASGWTCAHELPAALLGVISWLLCARRDFRQAIVAYLPAAAVPLGLFFLTNWLATGTLKPAYASFGTDKYNFVIEGVPSYWLEPKGIDRSEDSLPVYLFHCLIGHHGIFSLTPVWLLLIPAWLRRSCAGADANRSAVLTYLSRMTLLLTVAVLGFYLTRQKSYNYGGVSCGLRWMLWLTPLWIVSLIPLVDVWATWPGFRRAMVPVMLISAFSAWSRIDNPWRHPWIFTWLQTRGVIDLSDPRPPLAHPLWSWIAAMPDCSDGKPRWMEFVNASAPHGACRMRLTATPATADDASQVRLEISRQCADEPAISVCQVIVNRQRLAEGARPAEFLRWDDRQITPQKQQADLSLLRGLPLVKEFKPGVVRYRKTLLRTDAFRCQHAHSRVEIAAPAGNRNWRHGCDVWLCEELPFGVAEVEFQVHDAMTGLLLHQERWQAAACEPPPLPRAQWTPSP